jgi:predicted phosphohydrolase
MRLAVTADLHWGISPKGDAATLDLERRVAELAPDVFVIAGDVGEGDRFGQCLALFQGLECARLVIPGNHDLWTRGGSDSSLVAYRRRLPRTAEEQGFQYLDSGPYVAPDGREAVVGNINWYDYSFADPELEQQYPNAREMYREKRFPPVVRGDKLLRGFHNDGQYVHLGMSDDEFTGCVVGQFRKHLEKLPSSVESVIVIQHHPPLRELFWPSPLTTVEQRFWLAYTGNRRMHEAVLADPRVTTILCGHVHQYCEAEVEGRRCRNIGGDYDWKRLLLLDTVTGEEQWYDFGR